MKNLETFFTNVFDTQEISDDKPQKFANDHLQRLGQSDAYAALVPATEEAYTGYYGAITDEATQIAVRLGSTKAMQAGLEVFQNAVRRYEGAIRAAFDASSPQYAEFFPQGITEYARATLANVEPLMDRFANALKAHAAEIGQDTVNRFIKEDAEKPENNGFIPRFKSLRGAQLGHKGAVSTKKNTSTERRNALEVQLMKNLLTIALDHIGDVPGGMAFFDQAIVRTIWNGGNASATPLPAPEPKSSEGAGPGAAAA